MTLEQQRALADLIHMHNCPEAFAADAANGLADASDDIFDPVRFTAEGGVIITGNAEVVS